MEYDAFIAHLVPDTFTCTFLFVIRIDLKSINVRNNDQNKLTGYQSLRKGQVLW
jgi:hypothetical protein